LHEVIVWPTVHNALWQILDEAPYNKVVDRLCDQLSTRYDHWRAHRHPDDETLFVYWLHLAESENWHTFEFHVDDTMAAGHLFVIDVRHYLGKVRIH
jgi:hypothetical protein